jgi:DNA-binding transcriptional LysR family regulator
MADLNWYRNFVAVYRAGSVSGAARVKHLTQPAISQQLSALESSIGEPLFVRTPKGMQPTERGKFLYTQIAESLDRLERVNTNLSRVHNNAQNPIRLGTSPEFFSEYILPRVASHPLRLHTQFVDAKGGGLFAQLEAGTLDVVIGVQRSNMRALEDRVLLEKKFYLVGSTQLEPPRREQALSTWLRQQSWVSYSADLPMIRQFFSSKFKTRFDGHLALIVPDLRAVRLAVQLGMGISILPDFLCDEAIKAGQLQNLWGEKEVIPNERWLMTYRDVDAGRDEFAQLVQLLQDNG